ncbi:MAG: glycosyltransferase [Pseudomonadota bacterium]
MNQTARLSPLKHLLARGFRFAERKLLDDPIDKEKIEIPQDYFDNTFYQNAYKDREKASRQENIEHYQKQGWRLGYRPNHWFDVEFYIKANPDVANKQIDPFEHFMSAGRFEGRRPCKDSDLDETALRTLKSLDPHDRSNVDAVSAYFDYGYYLEQIPGLKANDCDPVRHYLAFGWMARHAPNRWFDIAYYLASNRDVKDAGLEPFYHYLRWGILEGRKPNEQGTRPETLLNLEPKVLDIVSKEFDQLHYQKQAMVPESPSVVLLDHYLQFGEQAGLSPNNWFDPKAYISSYLWGKTPPGGALYHYLTYGCHMGYSPIPPKVILKPLKRNSVRDLYDLEFDSDYYISQYGDVGGKANSALEDFIESGELDDRNPAAFFDSTYYRSKYMDPSDADGRPFEHYLRYGKERGFQTADASTVLIDKNARLPKTSVYGHFFKSEGEIGGHQVLHEADPSRLNIHFVIPDFRKGSGGHMTIFRMINWLEVYGHKLTIWIMQPSFHATEQQARETIHQSFQPLQADIKFLDNSFYEASGDAIFATAWQTAAFVREAHGFVEKFYFVQDHETEFYPTGTDAILAQRTYEWGLNCVCASPWLRTLMEEYGSWARHFWLAYDQELYCPPKKRVAHDVPQIAVYARHFTERRAVDLSLMALQELAIQGIEFHAHLFGADFDVSNCPFPATSHGVLSEGELASLYQDCDIGICFSATNYSLVPQEMMGTGLPVVELNSECSKAVYPDNAALKVGLGPRSIVQGIKQLIENKSAREELGKAGRDWVGQFSWESSAQMVEAAIYEKLAIEKPPADTSASVAKANIGSSRKKATVIIPTFNGGDLLSQVCASVKKQRAPWDFDVLLMDSTSTDGSFEAVQSQFPDFQFHQIPQSEFSHGGTRNRAVERTDSEFVCFLTQDALPADDFWLYNLVTITEAYPNSAGGYGRHKAYNHATAYTKRDLSNFFLSMDKGPVVFHQSMDRVLWNLQDRPYIQRLHYFSDNNSCLRRSVWDKIPYPEIKYGEDQAWAWEIIKQGYEKIYASSALVFHSHDYSVDENYKRSHTEAEFFREVFGYELLTSEGQAKTSLIGMNDRDAKWGVENGLPQADIDFRAKLNQAHLLGWLDGTLDQDLGFRPL